MEASADAVVAKDVVLVLDVSGSMDGEKIRQAKAAADYVLDHLSKDDRFNIVAFSTATRLFADRPVPVAQAAAGHAFVSNLAAQGSTDVNRALLEALAGADRERPTVVIFLTDGLPTAGEVNPDKIAGNIKAEAPKSVRLFAFGVGNDVDTVLLDQLGSDQRGASTYVRPGQSIEEELSGFYARVRHAAVLVDVNLSISGVRVEDIYPYPLPDLFADSQLVVAGRYRSGGSAALTLSGQVNGASQSYNYRGLTFVERGGQEFIARLWAQRKIGYLLSQIRLGGVKDELVKEVIALGTRYGIATPYTSFLVQEPGVAVIRDGVTPPGPAPAGGVSAPTAAPAAAPRSGQGAVEKAVAEQQLKSSEQAAAAPGQATPTLRQVGNKAFILREGAWVDSTFDATKMKAEAVVFGSENYFRLLSTHPEIGRYLALGDRVTVVLDGKAYAIVPEQPALRSAEACPSYLDEFASGPSLRERLSPDPPKTSEHSDRAASVRTKQSPAVGDRDCFAGESLYRMMTR